MGDDGKKEGASLPTALQLETVGPTSLEHLFHQYDEMVYRAAYRITGSDHDAEDVLQTVFLRLLRGGSTPAAEVAGNYLYRSAVNAALDVIRKRRKLRLITVEGVEPDALGNVVVLPDRELQDELRRALLLLKGTAAEMFVLSYFEEMDHGRIAEILDTSKAVVAVTLHRARTKLKKHLKSFMGGRS